MSFTLDLYRHEGEPEPQPPDVGDIILTARRAKVVTGVRPVESKVWHHRWRIDVTNVGSGRRDDPDVMAEVERLRSGGADVRDTGKYERGETPTGFAQAQGYKVEAG